LFSYETYLAQYDTNVFGVLKTTQAALPHFRLKAGMIVLIGSMCGWHGSSGAGAYVGSKFALEGMA
jgi:NAD(P)-dependent dehydrogenase (short-subunit alcohol dehydrogenase family)